MPCFDLSKLNFVKAKLMSWKRSNPKCNGNRRDKVALRTACNKNVKFKIIKLRTSFQYVEYFYYSQNLNWAAQNLWLGRGLNIAVLEQQKCNSLYLGKIQQWYGRVILCSHQLRRITSHSSQSRLKFFQVESKLSHGLSWPYDQHGLYSILYDTATLCFIWSVIMPLCFHLF